MRGRQGQPLPRPMTASGIRKSLDRERFLNYIDSKLEGHETIAEKGIR
jgi:hypothetical protein